MVVVRKAAPRASVGKDYVKLAASNIKPANEYKRPPRVLVYGRNKQGKTRFTGTAPRVLVIDPEGGSSETLTTQDIWPVSNWAELNDVWRYLQTEEARAKYDWIGVDGLTRISNMALRFVMQQQEERDLDRIPGMVQQRDYGRAGELMKGLLFNLHALPYGVVYTAQERMESGADFESDDEDSEGVDARFVPDLPKGVRNSVNAIVDVIGRIYSVKVEGTRNGETVKATQRRLWLEPTEKLDTGFRSGVRGVPPYLKNPTVPRLVDLLNGKESK